jgi:hypothetical protein
MKNCSFVSVGPCHQLRFCRNKGLRNVDVEEKEMLQLRSKVPFSDIKTICKHHEQLLDIQFSQWITKCSDPFKKHSTAVTRSLRIISLDYYSKTECLQGKVVPGEKLCRSCRIQAKPETEKSEPATQSTAEEPTPELVCNELINLQEVAGPSGFCQVLTSSTSSTTSDVSGEPDISLYKANTALEILGETPIKKSK